MTTGDKWVDHRAGPVVRPYAVTSGRTEPAMGEALDLVAVVVAAPDTSRGDDSLELAPEHRRILRLCRQPSTVVDVASGVGLPVGVVRVLLADLIVQGRARVLSQQRADELPSTDLLKEVLHGLRSL